MNSADAHRFLQGVDQEVNRMHRTIRLRIQAQLQRLEGCTLANTAENRELVKVIHAMLDRNGLRVQCPECGHPAILRVSPRRGSSRGAFVFDHTIDGRRTFHGGRGTLPPLRIVAKPARRQR